MLSVSSVWCPADYFAERVVPEFNLNLYCRFEASQSVKVNQLTSFKGEFTDKDA